MTYWECANCNQIETENNWISDGNVLICKHCCVTKRKELWPSADVRKLFSVVGDKDVKSSEYGIIASVFISTAFEILFEQLITKILLSDQDFNEIEYLINLVLDSNQGRSRRM